MAAIKIRSGISGTNNLEKKTSKNRRRTKKVGKSIGGNYNNAING